MSIATLLALLLLIAAVITVLPRRSAPKKSWLGYKSLCTFAPFSTLTLLVVAGVIWLVGNLPS